MAKLKEKPISMATRLRRTEFKAPKKPAISSTRIQSLNSPASIALQPVPNEQKHLQREIVLPRANPRFEAGIALTAQQYADEAARSHASKAGWLVQRTIESMTMVLDRVAESIPFADNREIKPLTETHQIASAEIRRALGLRDDIDASGARSLVQIQCVGTVSVQEAAAPMAVELPDVDFE